MQIQLCRKVEIFPMDDQKEVLWALSERCRLIYNFALAERREIYEKTGRGMAYTKQQNTLPGIKKKYPEYSWVYSKVLQMTLKSLSADYKSFFALKKNGDKNARPPSFKGKKYFTTMNYNQSGFRLDRKNNKISFTQFYKKDVELSFSVPDYLMDGIKRVIQISIFHNHDNDKFYLSLTYEEKVKKEYLDNGLYQAIDPGITKIVTAVNSAGKFFEVKTPRHDKYWNPIIDSLKSKRDHCLKGSRKWNRYNKTYRTCESRRAHQIKDFEHKLSRKMVDNTKANTIIIGKLDVKNMAQSDKATKGLNRATQSTGYLSRFIGFLTYKSELAGKKLIEINEEDTSKTCCCDGKKHDMPIWVRTMKCDCGNVIDRDKNSAVNIMVRFLSQNALWTGYREVLDNLRKTGMPIRALLVGNPLAKASG